MSSDGSFSVSALLGSSPDSQLSIFKRRRRVRNSTLSKYGLLKLILVASVAVNIIYICFSVYLPASEATAEQLKRVALSRALNQPIKLNKNLEAPSRTSPDGASAIPPTSHSASPIEHIKREITSPTNRRPVAASILPHYPVDSPAHLGYVIVPALTDPALVGAAMYDEMMAINQYPTLSYERSPKVNFPIGAVEGYIEGAPKAEGKLLIDVVYTFVDPTSKSFQSNMKEKQQRDQGYQTRSTSKAPKLTSKTTMHASRSSITRLWEELKRMVPEAFRFKDSSTEGPAFDSLLKDRLSKSILKLNAAEKVLASAFSSDSNDPVSIDSIPNPQRYRDWHELLYSLRALYYNVIVPAAGAAEASMSSFGNIYLVVADKDQIPKWLSLLDTRLVVVEHADIFPHSSGPNATIGAEPNLYLPSFNSYAIESCLHRIRGLSRHYLYFNNDMLLARSVSFFDFFQPHVVIPSNGSQQLIPEVRWLPALQPDTFLDTHCPKRGGQLMCHDPVTRHQLDILSRLNVGDGSKSRGHMVQGVRGASPDVGPIPNTIMTYGHMPILMDKYIVRQLLEEETVVAQRVRAMLERGLPSTSPASDGGSGRSLNGKDVFLAFLYLHYSLAHRQGFRGVSSKHNGASFGLEAMSGAIFGTEMPYSDSYGRERLLLGSFIEAAVAAEVMQVAPNKGRKRSRRSNARIERDTTSTSTLTAFSLSTVATRLPKYSSTNRFVIRLLLQIMAKVRLSKEQGFESGGGGVGIGLPAELPRRFLSNASMLTLSKITANYVVNASTLTEIQLPRSAEDIASITIDVFRSKQKHGSYDHWLMDYLTLLTKPIFSQTQSTRYYFIMMKGTARQVRAVQEDLGPRVGLVLFLTINDDVGESEPALALRYGVTRARYRSDKVTKAKNSSLPIALLTLRDSLVLLTIKRDVAQWVLRTPINFHPAGFDNQKITLPANILDGQLVNTLSSVDKSISPLLLPYFLVMSIANGEISDERLWDALPKTMRDVKDVGFLSPRRPLRPDEPFTEVLYQRLVSICQILVMEKSALAAEAHVASLGSLFNYTSTTLSDVTASSSVPLTTLQDPVLKLVNIFISFAPPEQAPWERP